MRRVWLLLRKDALVLRRSPLLLGILLAYPLAIAVLVGLVASYSNSKPRVGFVDQDNLPATVTIGGQRFDVNHTIDQVSKNVTLVRLAPAEAQANLRRMKQTPRIRQLEDFIHDARIALANTGDALKATAHPITIQRVHDRGRTQLLGANVQAYAMALTITFLALMLAAGSLAAER